MMNQIEIDKIIKADLIEKLKHTNPGIGYLYIIRSNAWPENVYKFGKTTKIKQRMVNYMSANPISPIYCYLIISTQICELEARIKNYMKNNKDLCFKESSDEWIKCDLDYLIKIINNFIQIDPLLKTITKECFDIPIYTIHNKNHCQNQNHKEKENQYNQDDININILSPTAKQQKISIPDIDINNIICFNRTTTDYGFSYLHPLPVLIQIPSATTSDDINNDKMPRAKILKNDDDNIEDENTIDEPDE